MNKGYLKIKNGCLNMKKRYLKIRIFKDKERVSVKEMITKDKESVFKDEDTCYLKGIYMVN